MITLEKVCSMKINQFKRFGDWTDTRDGLLIYKDNGSNILGVGHLDAVLYSKFKDQGEIVRCPQLDDRLGVYTILNMPGIDILLTDNEERGFSTAQYFTAQKDYNWIFEFDRQGMGSVTYQYKDKLWLRALEEYTDLEYGTYSDIADLEDLGVCGVNWGVAYHGQHTTGCYARKGDYQHMVNQFGKFMDRYKDQKFEHDDRVGGSYSGTSSGGKWTYDPKTGAATYSATQTGKYGTNRSLVKYAEPDYDRKGGWDLYEDDTPNGVQYWDGKKPISRYEYEQGKIKRSKKRDDRFDDLCFYCGTDLGEDARDVLCEDCQKYCVEKE